MVKDILCHFYKDNKVMIVENTGFRINVIFEGFVGQCNDKVPESYLCSFYEDWKVIGDMLTIWI